MQMDCKLSIDSSDGEESVLDFVPDKINEQPPDYSPTFVKQSRSSNFVRSVDPINSSSPYSYAVVHRYAFQHNELLSILGYLAKVEIGLSILFLVHGVVCPGYSNSLTYQNVCHVNIVGSLAGILTGGVGIAALNRYRWKGMMVSTLILTIISASGCLIIIVCDSVWLDKLAKLEDSSGVMRTLSSVMLLLSVALGVCFILTGTFICHHWKYGTMKYHVLGHLTQKNRVQHFQHPSDLPNPPDQAQMKTLQYHVCNPRAAH